MTRELPLLWLLTPRLTRPSTPGELARLPFIQLKNIPGPARVRPIVCRRSRADTRLGCFPRLGYWDQ